MRKFEFTLNRTGMMACKTRSGGQSGLQFSGSRAMVLVIITAALASQAVATQAVHDFRGRVVRVTDGDTIVVEDDGNRRHAVRIVSIDAPEKGRRGRAGQPYAERSKQHLARLVDKQVVRLVSRERDDYGRVLARVWARDAGMDEEFDVGLAQVCAGYAWLYEAFARTLAPAEQKAYRACQSQAKQDKRGLWQASKPVAPWQWRHMGSGSEDR